MARLEVAELNVPDNTKAQKSILHHTQGKVLNWDKFDN